MLVIVEWLDAHTLGQEEVPAEDAVASVHHGYLTKSCGFLVKSDAEGVTLTTDVQVDEDKTTYRHLHFIPRGMIRVERAIDDAKPAKRRRA